MKHLAALSPLVLLAFALTGCTSAEPESPAPAPPAAQPSAAPKPEISSTPYGYVTLHTAAQRRLLTETERSDFGHSALITGALAVNDLGCFGLGNEEEGWFSPVVFPYGTGITGDGPDAGIEFEGARFQIGDVLALGGGGGNGIEKDSPEQPAFEACGFSEEAFMSWGEVQLLADFEREIAERDGQ
jgi:hypothetical protein